MKKEQKTFAFKLADIKKQDAAIKQEANKDKKWQVRDGVSIAGCTGSWHCPAWSDGAQYC